LEGLLFFVGDVISGIDLDFLSRGHWALSPNRKSHFFDSSFYWKLGYNLSL